jgi:branched-chain amino acid aminotransferase
MLNDEQKLNPYDHQAGHKTLDYFSRLAALREAVRRGAGEALWFNVHNYLQSASIANVFLVKDKVLLTPPTNEELRDPALAAACPYPKSNVLPGVTRSAILDIARGNNVPVRLEALNVTNVLEADEIFLTNSIMQIMPVGRVEKHTVGQSTPGDITQMLISLLQDELAK